MYFHDPEKQKKAEEFRIYFEKIFVDLDNKSMVETHPSLSLGG